MNIVIDCFKLVKGVGKSIGIYNLALNLVKNLCETQKENKHSDCKLIVIGNKYNKVDFALDGVEFFETQYNPKDKLFCIYWELILVTKYYKKLNADMILFPRGYAPLSKKVNDMIIVHDMIPFYYDKYFPGYFNKLENFYIMTRLKGSIKKCKKVVTISDASKQEIMNITKVNQDKITIIHNGYNEIDTDNLTPYEELKKEPYIVAMTSGLPHKNSRGIIEAYDKYCTISENPIRLVVIGIEDIGDVQVSKTTESKITCMKYIGENSKLHYVFANAKVFLFLSLAEGFGFPPIEAMQLGVPVVCSNSSSLPEVVGDAALTVNPTNAEETAQAIERVLTDEKLKNELIEKGYANIKRFDWQKVVKAYWKAIEQMCK